jgi:hypothetical protein
VLQVGDHDEVRVNEEVRDAVVEHHLGERASVRPVRGAGEDSKDAEVRPEDLPLVVLAEDDRVGGEV